MISIEDYVSDPQANENFHKKYSKLLRNTESFEQSLENEIKQLIKLQTEEESDNKIKETPILERINYYFDVLYMNERGKSKKPAAIYRDNNLFYEDDDIMLVS